VLGMSWRTSSHGNDDD